MTAVTALLDEAVEIRANIRTAARNSEITWLQCDTLLELVATDVRMKIKPAANLLTDWTGNYNTGAEPVAE